MKKMVDVGIVMPVYKQVPAYLEAAIQSVLSQTLTTFRMVIVIDGAPEMEPFVREYVRGDERVKIVSYPKNKGVGTALNTGFDVLKDDPKLRYWTWVSSDNTYHPQFLEVLRRALHNGPDQLGLVYSSFHSIDNDGNRILNDKSLMLQRQYQSQPKEELMNGSIVGVSFMYKAQYAKMIDGYKMEPVEDYEYWLRLSELCDIRFIPVELMNYRVDSTLSVSSTLKSILQHRKWRYAFHLARHQARIRRKIEPEVSILCPLQVADAQAIERIENLYEQVYSNYHFFVIDLSLDQQVTRAVSQVSHPTTIIRWLPKRTQIKAIKETLPYVKTPMVMVLGRDHFVNTLDLQVLTRQLNRMGRNYMSGYYTPDHRDVGYRTSEAPVRPGYTEELFWTDAFRSLIESGTLGQE
ncbi:glycosyltransferase involved in cell wall biosynthesis [Paenibacillus phyllosphaerae]|uniref:Glycosyltransferase involved in cell wall biosynthesis n=1 Tax=Paenibacillus phyllosphaerae TaxID=274593 RepID=A0A7W5AWX3_9BACL|nr:glycosyltransferase [Paenibacillus phyllosphaerae]MBB3110243.1 glycosyltransferase involved in cell wall biosynthesis [Paenibacillus phyllosphaerae]